MLFEVTRIAPKKCTQAFCFKVTLITLHKLKVNSKDIRFNVLKRFYVFTIKTLEWLYCMSLLFSLKPFGKLNLY